MAMTTSMPMATGADIPPELFRRILFDVCEDASSLLDPDNKGPKQKEDIKTITACSLVCVYWARVCREELFHTVWIKNYEDMRAFSSLVSATPKRFKAVSEYAYLVILSQRVGERPWIHFQVPRLRRSLFPSKVHMIRLHVDDTPSDPAIVVPRRSTYHRLFAGLPRTLPSSCFQYIDLTLDKAHFATHRDLASLLEKIDPQYGVRFYNVTWDAQAHFDDDLLTYAPLQMPTPYFYVHARGSTHHTAETVWLSFATVAQCLSLRHRYASVRLPKTSHDGQPGGKSSKSTSQVLVFPSVQLFILDICKALCRQRMPWLFLAYMTSYRYSRLLQICNVTIAEDYPRAHILSKAMSSIHFSFYASPSVSSLAQDEDLVSVDHIFALCAHTTVYDKKISTVGGLEPPTGMQEILSYPWEEIVEICAAQERFTRLQLSFDKHEYLVQFMEAQRATLAKLDGRVHLYYRTQDFKIHAADFETLNELPGDAYSEHDYITYGYK